MSPIGKVLLGLPEADAVHWLLTIETQQSLGDHDEAHMHRDVLETILREPAQAFGLMEGEEDDGLGDVEVYSGDEWPFATLAFARLCDLGVVERRDGSGPLEWGYELRPAFRPTLEDIVAQKRTPFSLLAEALIADERSSLSGHATGIVTGPSDSAALAPERHSRMVAHELHNAIVPMQHALQKLCEGLTQRDPEGAWRTCQQRIERNVARVLRFADQMAQTSSLAVQPAEPFGLVLAVRDALAELNGGIAGRAQFAPPPGALLVVGHRHRFVMAIVNLLRNAVQAVDDRDVRVRVEVAPDADDRLRVAVHDDGPGVVVAYREAIFQRNFTLRTDGRGQGLALVRDVIEGDDGWYGAVRTERPGWRVLRDPAAGRATERVMNVEGRVLIVDDEQDIIDTYREILAEEGYASEAAKTRADAVEALKRPGWAVVLLDQRLRGPDDNNSGLDLLRVIQGNAPFAKVIVVTGYAEPDSVRRAFAEGAWDYLQKDSLLDSLLRVKVRNAMEFWRERVFAALTFEKREQEIVDTWKLAQTEVNSQKKGKHLETLMLMVFRSTPGFEQAVVNSRNALKEIDVVVQNNSTDPFWQKERGYVLAECKNWSTSVGVPELKLFRTKIEDRYGRSALGFFIAVGGYADTVNIEEWTRRSRESLVVLLDKSDVDALVAAKDRSATLKEFHLRAVVAGRD